MIQRNDRIGCFTKTFCYMRRHITFVFILKGMFDRCPEIHCHGTDLYFYLKPFRPMNSLHCIIKNHVITPVTALLDMRQIVLFTFDFHICSFSDDRSNGIDIFFKLTYDPYSCQIFHFCFQLFDRDIFTLHFLQDTGNTFYSSTDLFNGRISIIFVILFYHMFKLDCQFFDRQLVRAQNTSP